MKKHRMVWIILVILFGIGICTVVSARNYVEDKPVVILTDTVPNSMHKQLQVTAGLYYSETEWIEFPENCRIETVYAQNGDKLEAGAPLLQLKEADVQIQYLQMQLQRESLEEEQDAGGTREELAGWKLQSLEEELAYLEQLLAADCVIKVASDSVVLQQEYEAGDYTAENKRAEVAFPEYGCYLEWSVGQADYLDYRGTAVISGEKIELSWEQPGFAKGMYTYVSELPEIVECMHGEPVEVELLYTSQEYRAVLPKDSIWYDTDGSPYIFQTYSRTRVFGTEYYVRKIYVEIVEQDDVNVAISSPATQIVERTSMKLSDMMAVTVIEE